jgi:hypothetical protein
LPESVEENIVNRLGSLVVSFQDRQANKKDVILLQKQTLHVSVRT